MTKRNWFRVHSFTGVITGLLLFVICWSGTFAVISHELDWLVTNIAKTDYPLNQESDPDWQAIYDAVTDHYPEGVVQWMEKPLYAQSSAQVVMNFPNQEYVRVYVDPSRFEVLGKYSYINIQRFFRSFHMNLFLPNTIGSYIVMFFSITLLVSSIAALYFYRRWWARFFRFKFTKKAFWSELHKSVGLWSLWFIFVISLTGCWYLFELMRSHIGDGKVVFTGTGNYAVHQIPKPELNSGHPVLSLNELLDIAKSKRPEIDIRQIFFNWGEDGHLESLYINGQGDEWLVRNRANQITLNSQTGDVLYSQDASDYPLYWRLSDTADPLHFGDFGGLISKVIWFVFGLFLSGIILTGTWLHARRLIREQAGKRRHYWPGTLPALVVTVLILSASAPFGVIGLREYYGVNIDGIQTLPELAPGVSAVITLWIVVTLGILALWCYWLVPRRKPNNQ